jgi:outer membrane protein OmpA-like peptidoglycan-associated protein
MLENKNDSISETQAELFAGLMMLFLFIAIVFMMETENKSNEIIEQKDKIEDVVENWAGIRLKIYDELKKEFEDDLEKWNAEIDNNLTLRFNEPDMLFSNGKANLKKEFRLILDDFWPRYLAILQKYDHNISEIKIEGHTSSIWSKNASKRYAYYQNMKLSQKRTIETLDYCMKITPGFENFIIEKVTANGKSFSKMRKDKNGNVSEKLSRRVEFSIMTNDKEAMDIIKSL